MATRHISTLIVGAGASGLSLASRVNDQPLVLSQSPIGGLISSNHRGEFIFDYGGHVYTPDDPTVVALMRKAGATFHEDRKAYFGQAMIPYPVQDHADQLDLVAGPENPGKIPVRNFVDYCRAQLGTDFTEKFMVPFNRRVWQIDPRKMDFDWVEGRVKVKTEPREHWGMNASFYYAPGDQLVEVLKQDALGNGATIEMATLLSIDGDKHIATFLGGDEKEVFTVKYGRIFVTTDYFTSDLPSNSIATIGVGLSGYMYHETPFHWMYCDLDSYVHRVTWLSRYHPGMAPKGHDSLLLEIPFRGVPPLDAYVICNSRPDVNRIEEAQRILKNAGFNFNLGSIETVWGAITPGYPIPTLGSRRIVSNRKQVLAKEQIFLAGRWGAHGYFNLQHIFKDADAVVDFAEHGASQLEYLNSSFYYRKAV